jgi:sialate O-acetylesterase
MNRTRRKINAAIVAVGTVLIWYPLSAAPDSASSLAAEELDVSRSNLLTNPSFEQEAKLADESSLPGWELSFRHRADQPLLTSDEVAVIDDPQKSHSGRRFLRIRPRDREIVLRSPKAQGFEPGLYEVSAWVRGRPGTVAGFALPILGANFGAGIFGLNDQWQKFSMVVYSSGVSGHITFPDQTQLLVAVFHAGERGQIADPQLDIDDVSIVRLTSGLADTFGDHMVLQRDRPVPIRGWAKNPGQSVAVAFNGQTKTAIADKEGRWQTALEPMQAGGPYVLKLDGRPTAWDVMVGDVWICSGQSNMEFGIDLLNGYFNHAPEIVAQANQPQIRLWQASKQFSPTPLHSYLTRQSSYPIDFQAKWDICSPGTVSRGIWGGFSAVGYFFGRDIQADQKVTIGLMMIANGGTQIESFISEEGLRAIPPSQWIVPPLAKAAKDHLQNTPFPKLPNGIQAPSAAYAEMVAGHINPNSQQGAPDNKAFHYASAAYNGLVAPVFPFSVRGVLWYQGEHNGNDPHYETKLKALIADWRARFGDNDLPFVIAQLPFWRTSEPARWQLVREAQLHVSQTVPNTALAVTIDLADKEGDGYGVGEIHPKRKLEVGQRMALAARAVAYGEKIVSSGPIYRAMESGSSRITLRFDSVGDGLEARGGKLVGFQIAGSDQRFVDADAVISGNTVVVSSPSIRAPVAVRYGFAQFVLPVPNLYNKAGLPASPFRTDDWPVK